MVARFGENPEPPRDRGPFSLERVARVNHSSEGQAYEALFNLIRYEKDPALRSRYFGWMTDLWEMNWMEGNSLFTYMTIALAPQETDLPHREESLRSGQRDLAPLSCRSRDASRHELAAAGSRTSTHSPTE